MNGIDYLIDSNILIGLLNGDARAMEQLQQAGAMPSRCAFSSISRMEVLGWQGMTHEQERTITSLLSAMRHMPIDASVENAAIALRRSRKIKLPDAIIAATAQVHGLTLLSRDDHLLKVAQALQGTGQ